MKKLLLFLVVVVCCFSCRKEDKFVSRNISKVEIKHILKDSMLSIRAIEIFKNETLQFAGNRNAFGEIYLNSNEWVISQQKFDSLEMQFRSIAYSSSHYYMASIGNPALIFNHYKELVYQENHPKIFYDSMDFWNDKEGIAIGDSTDGCLSVIITRDGGNSWTKLTCDELPKGLKDEGAFAASDSNIAIVGDKTWVATTAGRVYYSPDKGQTWEVFDTPIIKDKETEGIYSIDFYDELSGYAIGGDYTKPDDNTANKIKTTDGGKTWQLVAENENPGYRSCVQYMPNSEGKELVAIGFKGIDYSNDAGESWKHLSDEGFYTIRFLNDSVAYAAGAGRISKLTFRE
ncbi:WD40/YVTN/BNR-like repeat-containing protein [Seonamhaeicola maritimus]|uniref:Oxidoreductase n=1 Tax=Seonamhaeicola maritimus TaxID=2591822 RepID=A0A5C7GE92_9FLAO|nr:oxidoreductase [Seonamhaeicola maritimus]TXG35251.1 oxidoreductase [Seonamhaeicola maritimus]